MVFLNSCLGTNLSNCLLYHKWRRWTYAKENNNLLSFLSYSIYYFFQLKSLTYYYLSNKDVSLLKKICDIAKMKPEAIFKATKCHLTKTNKELRIIM